MLVVFINLSPSLEADYGRLHLFWKEIRLFHIFALRKVLKATEQFSKCLNEIDLIMYVYDDDTSDHTDAVYTEKMAERLKISKILNLEIQSLTVAVCLKILKTSTLNVFI